MKVVINDQEQFVTSSCLFTL